MKLNLKRTIATLAGVAAVATILPVLAAPAALAAPTPSGTATLSPTSGDSATDYTFTLPAGASCPGDGSAGWRVTSYVVPVGVDPASLTFNSEGPIPQKVGAPYQDFRMPLFTNQGESYTTAQPANADPNATNKEEGVIINLPAFDFEVYTAQGSGGEIPPGSYNVGIACVQASGTSFPIDKFWNNTMTLTASTADTGPAGISWAQGAPAPAATITGVAAGNGQLAISFTGSGADNWTAQASTTSGDFTSTVGTSTTATSAGTVTISGLTNDTQYYVRVLANKAGFAPTASDQSGPHKPVAGSQPGVQNLTSDGGAAGSTSVALNWDAPSGGLTPTGSSVTIDPNEGTVAVDNNNTSATITGLVSGKSYTCTVTPTYSDSTAVATPASTNCTPTATGVTVLQQNVTVTRPAGALVFTQICEDSKTGAPLAGHEFSKAACAIAFGTATRVIPAAGGAPYFAATASLNNVQVDNYGDDNGWTVTGDMSEFVSGDPATAAANQRFSGDQLGWAPKLASKTDGMTVNLGTAVPAGTTTSATTKGMSDSPTLASSPATASLGIAELDAALDLVIPTSKRAGEYKGTLTMTATPGA